MTAEEPPRTQAKGPAQGAHAQSSRRQERGKIIAHAAHVASHSPREDELTRSTPNPAACWPVSRQASKTALKMIMEGEEGYN